MAKYLGEGTSREHRMATSDALVFLYASVQPDVQIHTVSVSGNTGMAIRVHCNQAGARYA